MFGLIIFIIVSYFICLGVTYFKEYQDNIKILNAESALVSNTELLSCGRRIVSFTIEKLKMVENSCVYRIGIFRIPILELKCLMGGSFKLKNQLVEKAVRANNLRVKEKVQKAEYVVNYRVQINWISRYAFEVHSFGTAVFLYPETIGFYNIQQKTPLLKFTNQPQIISSAVSLAAMVFCLFSLHVIEVNTNAYLIRNISFEQEKLIWTWIENNALEKRRETKDLIAAEQLINGVLANIKAKYPIKYDDTYAHIVLDPIPDSLIYPNGNIVITSGLLERLENENQLAFILAHQMGHIENEHHLKSFKDSMINYYLLTKIFGDHNWLMMRFLYPPKALEENFYNTFEESVADQFALNIMEKTYGGYAGISNLKNILSATDSDVDIYTLRHEESDSNQEKLDQYVQSNQSNSIIPMHLLFREDVIEAKAVEELNLNASSNVEDQDINTQILAKYNDYNIEVKQLRDGYEANFQKYMTVLAVNSGDTAVNIQSKKDFIYNIKKYVKEYDASYKEMVARYDEDFAKLFGEIADSQSSDLQKISWRQEKEGNLLNHYAKMKMDLEIYDAQIVVLEFVMKRFGSYSIGKKGLEFKSSLSQDSYNQLNNKLLGLIIARNTLKTPSK